MVRFLGRCGCCWGRSGSVGWMVVVSGCEGGWGGAADVRMGKVMLTFPVEGSCVYYEPRIGKERFWNRGVEGVDG